MLIWLVLSCRICFFITDANNYLIANEKIKQLKKLESLHRAAEKENNKHANNCVVNLFLCPFYVIRKFCFVQRVNLLSCTWIKESYGLCHCDRFRCSSVLKQVWTRNIVVPYVIQFWSLSPISLKRRYKLCRSLGKIVGYNIDVFPTNNFN